ncbi:DUF983 domain-containing protein [Winogradskyella psychrotolerans]|uniref:DUF983 domain-containing protein n=1 Tax=Winogradskyella psychrotolerans TaxID=1344585 RepID=UPI001C065BCC|nr:DUF983 domain-containing protein [Winogradskyella psychrotolerans]MBU2927428.1 DUF983 domain-containing protein [Winogradskyella psychrotolerans]
MIRKGMKLYSILFGVCPKCHQESMYQNKNPYVLSDVIKMNETCSHCKTKYEIEPSFFYGSMYVSYAVGIAFAVAAFIISYNILESSLTIAFVAIIATLIGFFPIIMRLSRNIWINIFMSYDKELAKTSSTKK